jgi:hypothetical protein
MNGELTEEQREAIRQKEYVLASGNKVGYSPIPHSLYQRILPELSAKYGGQTARDCVFLYTYLHAFVNGNSSKTEYMWAFPTVKKIREDTGIHGDRIKGLSDILEAEGLIITRKLPWYGHTKKMYMPLYPKQLL